MNRHDGPALIGIGVGALVSGLLTWGLLSEMRGRGFGPRAEPRPGLEVAPPVVAPGSRPLVDFAVIRVPDPHRPRVRVRMSVPEGPTTGRHEPRDRRRP